MKIPHLVHTFTGRRTRLLPGREANYRVIHSRIPEAVALALRDAGVVSWRIWEDGLSLFHAIETREGYPAMVEKIESLGPIDTEWDAVIVSLLDSTSGNDVMLPLVWGMDSGTQWDSDADGQIK